MAAAGASRSPLDLMAGAIAPVLAIWNAHTGERLQVHYFRAEGYDGQALAQLNWIMRDWRESAVATLDVRLFWALSAVAQAAMQQGHSGLIRLNSGYRTPRTNSKLEGAVPNSMHLSARAVDFMLDGVPTPPISAYCRWLGVGGVGHYPGRFVHLDTGHVRTWTG